MRFEWDGRKANLNLNKHGVSFEEAATVFANPLAAIYDDPDHSVGEQRYYIIGWSTRKRLLVVWFVERSGSIRIFSARQVTNRERKGYESKRKG